MKPKKNISLHKTAIFSLLKKAPGISTHYALEILSKNGKKTNKWTFKRAKNKFFKQGHQFGEHSVLGSRDTKIAKRLHKGDSPTKVAKDLQISRSTVYKISDIMEQYGIPASYSARKTILKKEIKEIYAKNPKISIKKVFEELKKKHKELKIYTVSRIISQQKNKKK